MIEKNIIDNYISGKIKSVSDSAVLLNKIAEDIKKEDEFQDDYIEFFNSQLDELIYTAKNLKITER